MLLPFSKLLLKNLKSAGKGSFLDRNSATSPAPSVASATTFGSLSLTRLVALFFFAGLIFFGGQNLQEVSAREGVPQEQAESAVDDSSIYEELKLLTDVIAVVKRDYVREVRNREVVEGAIKGLLSTLDPHSGYLDPEFYQDLQVQTKGEFGGLGIEITVRDGLLVVVAPMEGSPAAQVGIRPGDAIVKIDGKFTKEFSLVDAVKRLRGPRGSEVTVSVQRKGTQALLDFKLARDNIQVKSIKSRYLGDGFGYVRISQFMERTGDDLKQALARLVKQNSSKQLRGLILDLRNNPGGLLTQAIVVSDLFLTEGVIAYTDGRVEAQKQKFFAHSRGTEPDYPIVVLVNGGSASASEIVAGALKDHGRALILGTQTFGKGSVQTITPLRNGGALTLTTALYYTKSGRSLQALGVAPDIILEAESDTPVQQGNASKAEMHRSEMMREGDLPGAIGNPQQKLEPQRQNQKKQSSQPGALQQINRTPIIEDDYVSLDPERVELDVWTKRDRQFQRAIDLLKTFNIFGVVKESPESAT
jgi:carboxyl-terminal processing protease